MNKSSANIVPLLTNNPLYRNTHYR